MSGAGQAAAAPIHVMDYRAMTGGDWALLAIVVALCLLVAWVLAFRPMIPWRSTQRWRAPEQDESELGEPTAKFCRTCRIIALAVLLVGVFCLAAPAVPAWMGAG